MDMAVIVLDYYLQMIENGIDKNEALQNAMKKLDVFSGSMEKLDTQIACDLMNRIGKLV